MNLADGAARSRARPTPTRSRSSGPSRSRYGELAGRRRPRSPRRLAPRRRSPATGSRSLAGNEPAFVAAYLATLRGGRGRGPAQRRLAVARARARARRGRARARRRVAGATPTSRGARARSATTPIAVAVVDDSSHRRPRRRPAAVARDARRSRGAAVHRGHRGRAEAGDAHARFAAREPRADAVASGAARHADDVALGVLPLFHVFGLNVVLGLALMAGAARRRSSITSIRPRRSRACAPTASPSSRRVPAIFEAWLALDDDAAPARRVRARAALRLGRGAAAARARRRRCATRFGVDVHDGYGLTEASPVVTTTAVGGGAARRFGRSAAARVSRCGSSTPTATTCSKAIPARSSCAAPNVFAGYWNDPDATAARARRRLAAHRRHRGRRRRRLADARRPGQGRRHRVGLQRVSRAKSSTCSRSHADVADVAVVGEPHPRTGETVVAYVVAEPGRAPDPGRAAAARGPPARALQAADARRARRRAAAHVRGQAGAARAVVGRSPAATAATRVDATTRPTKPA